MGVHIEQATAGRKPGECVEANHRPRGSETFDEPGEKHGSPTLEHAEFHHHAVKAKPRSIGEALIEVDPSMRVPICERRNEEVRHLLLQHIVAEGEMAVASE